MLKQARKGRRKGVYQFIDDMVDVCSRVMTSASGIPEAQARELAHEMAVQMCFHYARTTMYVPAALDLQLSERDEEIWRKYGTDSGTARPYSAARVAELAAEHQLTTVQIYNIVRQAKSREIARRQQRLPGFDVAETAA